MRDHFINNCPIQFDNHFLTLMFMKNFIRSATFAFITFSYVQAQEINLFNGSDLAGWKGLPEIWSVQDGAITARVTSSNKPSGQTDLVWEGGQVSDFELSCEAKMDEQEGSNFCNSGIYFRGRIINPATFQMVGYQADLVLNSKMPTILGAMAGELNGKERMLTKVGESVTIQPDGGVVVTETLDDARNLLTGFKDRGWNTYRVTAVGNVMHCYINNKPISSVTDLRPDRNFTGLIGLQMLARKPMIVQFKNIRLRLLKAMTPLSPIASASTAIVTAIQTDPNQMKIEVIKEQGPNAAEWALTALDESIPPDIRKNLAILREDLLDEGAKATKGNSKSYQLASDYCDKILAALDQREIARVNAGYRAAQADANKDFSNQALDARRNYKMRWPQYAREESQRVALRENETDKADVKKERIKVEWAERARQMRLHLDEVYRKLREAMR